jgi:hypothetical protein
MRDHAVIGDGSMAELVWAKHPETGGLAEVPKAAIPQLRQSGWEPLSDKEVADLEKTEDETRQAAEDDMRAKASAGALEPEETPTKSTAGKSSGKSSTATKENS